MASPDRNALLIRIPHIPRARWGQEEAYQSYKARTPVLILRPPRR